MQVPTSLTGLVLLVLLAACSESPTRPSSGALVTFDVSGERFSVWLNTPEQVQAARNAHGGGTERVPNGRIVSGTRFNTGWSWHLEDVEFAAVTMELCDGRPSDVERHGTSFGGGRFCPWGAAIVQIEEF